MTDNCLQPVQKFGPQPTDDTPLLCLQPRGLAIFPTRYAVFPDTPAFAGINLPGGMGDKVTDVALKHHKYGLRLLRKGFVYIYYHDHPNNKKWDIYEVDEDSTLDQLGVKAFKRGEKKVLLANKNCFFIEKPWDINKVDFAFSEHPWSKETLEQMESDGALRDKRMQTFRPSVWINSPSYPHGKKLTVDNLEKVLEYSDEMDAYDQLHEHAVACRSISDGQGHYQSDTLKLCSSAFPFRMRTEELEPLVKEINLAPNSQRNQPMMLALWDAVGITREINGFALDAAGWAAQYFEQYELELDAIKHIELIQRSLEEVSKAKNKQFEGRDKDYLSGKVGVGQQEHIDLQNQRQENLLKQKLKMQYADVPASELYKIPSARIIVDELIRLQKIKDEKQKPLEERLAKRQQKRIADDWSKYKNKINDGKVTTIKQAVTAIEKEATDLIAQRITDQIAWLESTHFTDALVEFHENQRTDGNYFKDLVGDLLLGLGSCDIGSNKLNQYVSECSVNEQNIFWRAVAANQKKEKAQLDALLAEAKGRGDETLDDAKVFALETDLYDRLAEIAIINSDSHGIEAEVVGKKVPTGGLDKIYASVGIRLFTPIIKLAVDTPKMIIVKSIYEASLGFRTQSRLNKLVAAQDSINFAHDNSVQKQSQSVWNKYERIMDIDERITSQKQKVGTTVGNKHLYKNRQNKYTQQDYEDWYRKHGHKLDAESKNLQYEIGRHKQEIERLAEFRKGQLSKVQYSYEHSVKSLNRNIGKKIDLYEKWNASEKGISFGFGIIIIAFQAAALRQVIAALGNNPEDKELKLKLTVAGTGILGTGAAFAANLINNEKSIMLKGLKISGGKLLIVNGFLSAHLDYADARKNLKKDEWALVAAFGIKGTLNVLGGSLSTVMLASIVSQSWEAAISLKLRPIALRLGKIGIDATGRFVLARFIGIASLWVGLGILALEIIIMLMYEDELEEWIDKTTLAKDPDGKAFTSIEQQQAAFHQAIEDLFGKSDEAIEKEKQQQQYQEQTQPFELPGA